MKTAFLVCAVAMLAFAAGCASKSSPDDNGGSSRTVVEGRLKAQATATMTATENTPAAQTATQSGTGGSCLANWRNTT